MDKKSFQTSILRMNRHQNELEMLFADAHKGAVTVYWLSETSAI